MLIRFRPKSIGSQSTHNLPKTTRGYFLVDSGLTQRDFGHSGSCLGQLKPCQLEPRQLRPWQVKRKARPLKPAPRRLPRATGPNPEPTENHIYREAGIKWFRVNRNYMVSGKWSSWEVVGFPSDIFKKKNFSHKKK